MARILEWPDKTPAEKFRNGADWSMAIGDATILSCTAEAVGGDVELTVPTSTDFEGAMQGVWVTGGAPGLQVVRLGVHLSDGRFLQQDFKFILTA